MTNSDNITGFINSSKGFAKNPLGIIALFISLIYGFACLVIGVAGNSLEKNERFILIIFLVSFPIVILISFVFLVTKHYRKLYSPADFKDEKNYLETIDINYQKSRIQNKVIESEVQVTNPASTSSDINHIDTLSNYLIVENLILRIVEKDYNLPLRRNVQFKKSQSTFDCILEGKDIFVGVEIKYYFNVEIKHIESVSLHLRRRLHTFQRIAKEYYPNKRKKFVLYIVYDTNIDDFKNSMTRLFENENSLEMELKFFNYKYLLEKFGFSK